MRYLSVCSGIEAATVAWHGLGWQPVGFSEIEPFPSAVLAHHYPTVPNLGDMTRYKEWDIGTIDLFVGGTPCQSFSVAGLRKGLEDPRGNLALVYCGILDHFRPKWFVWENVPGVLSSAGGRDFGSFLGAVAQLGYGFAYRVLDAQFFGVAQRRRRVFVVGYLGDWRPAAAVLFERQSLRRDTAPSREKRQDPSAGTPLGLGPGGELARALNACKTASGRMDVSVDTFVAHTLRGEGFDASEDGTGRGTPLVAVGSLCARTGLSVSVQDAAQGHLMPIGIPDVMSTLLSSTAGISRPGNAATEHETYIPMAQPIAWDEELNPSIDVAGTIVRGGQGGRHDGVAQPISIHPHCIGRSPEAGPQGKEYLLDGSAYCMDSRGQPQAVAQPIGCFKGGQGSGAGGIGYSECVAPTLPASDGGNRTPTLLKGMVVRRLTPVECERLQGFPDNYTAIPWRGKTETPDGPRYKALGNSMAVPVMKWIGEKIQRRAA
jgi:DNA (cytosine-5)-methyltransferase 1